MWRSHFLQYEPRDSSIINYLYLCFRTHQFVKQGAKKTAELGSFRFCIIRFLLNGSKDLCDLPLLGK